MIILTLYRIYTLFKKKAEDVYQVTLSTNIFLLYPFFSPLPSVSSWVGGSRSAGVVVRLHDVLGGVYPRESGRPKGQPRPIKPTTWTQRIAGCSCTPGVSKRLRMHVMWTYTFSVSWTLPKAYYQLFQNGKLKLFKKGSKSARKTKPKVTAFSL